MLIRVNGRVEWMGLEVMFKLPHRCMDGWQAEQLTIEPVDS